VQDAVKKFQDSKNKEHEKTQKQINELREDLKKWNKGHYKERDIWIKYDNAKYTRRAE
jgi:hypothetical protein